MLSHTQEELINYIGIMDTCEKAIKTFGEKHQIRKCREEANELVSALYAYQSKHVDDLGKRVDGVIDELADVQIMLFQMGMIFDRIKISDRIKFKIDRLKRIIDEEEKKGSYGTSNL